MAKKKPNKKAKKTATKRVVVKKTITTTRTVKAAKKPARRAAVKKTTVVAVASKPTITIPQIRTVVVEALKQYVKKPTPTVVEKEVAVEPSVSEEEIQARIDQAVAEAVAKAIKETTEKVEKTAEAKRQAALDELTEQFKNEAKEFELKVQKEKEAQMQAQQARVQAKLEKKEKAKQENKQIVIAFNKDHKALQTLQKEFAEMVNSITKKKIRAVIDPIIKKYQEIRTKMFVVENYLLMNWNKQCKEIQKEVVAAQKQRAEVNKATKEAQTKIQKKAIEQEAEASEEVPVRKAPKQSLEQEDDEAVGYPRVVNDESIERNQVDASLDEIENQKSPVEIEQEQQEATEENQEELEQVTFIDEEE